MTLTTNIPYMYLLKFIFPNQKVPLQHPHTKEVKKKKKKIKKQNSYNQLVVRFLFCSVRVAGLLQEPAPLADKQLWAQNYRVMESGRWLLW